MSSTLLLRTLLIASALSGALVFACGEDTSQNTDNSKADDDDGDDDDTPRRDAGGRDAGKADARAADGGRRDGGSSTGTCPAIPVMQCTTDDDEMGISTCNPSTGEFGECTSIAIGGGDAGEPVEECPDGFMCQTIPMVGSTCAMGTGFAGIVRCMTADECEGAGLEGAVCRTFGSFGGFCQLPCVPGGGTTPPSDAGGGDDEEDAGDVEPTGDAGGSTGGDAGRDSGSSSGSSDAGRDAGRDR
jgi:hypothetical protein